MKIVGLWRYPPNLLTFYISFTWQNVSKKHCRRNLSLHKLQIVVGHPPHKQRSIGVYPAPVFQSSGSVAKHFREKCQRLECIFQMFIFDYIPWIKNEFSWLFFFNFFSRIQECFYVLTSNNLCNHLKSRCACEFKCSHKSKKTFKISWLL